MTNPRKNFWTLHNFMANSITKLVEGRDQTPLLRGLEVKKIFALAQVHDRLDRNLWRAWSLAVSAGSSEAALLEY